MAPPSDERIGIPLHPTGWYVLCFSAELAPRQVIHGTYFGQELVIYRTAAGAASVVDAHCPHMGAHLGHGGTVEGETLRCPFHGFCFDTEGTCVSTPYGRRPPRASLRKWRTLECNGAVFTWYDEAGREPLWEIPRLAPDGYARLRTKIWRGLRSHPQETTENSVDMGHLSVVHGYQDVDVVKPLALDGPYLNTRYAMSRRNPFVPGLAPIRAEFEVHVHGLGYSFVEVDIPAQQMQSRHFVFPTPVEAGRIDLRVAVAVNVSDPRSVALPLGLLPRHVATALIGEMALRAYTHDVAQDFDIWENKRYLQPPALADGDGPVGPYRRWCKQFYPHGSPAGV
jgi:nitrite reductase/ring-hydroxylating ferredoxin subunit